MATIGPASFRSRHEMLSRPVALFGDYLPSNLKTSVAEACCKLIVVETGFMYESKFPLGSVEARFEPTDVKWSFKISLRIGIWFTHKNGDFGAVSATERSWTTQILKVDRHLSVEFFSCNIRFHCRYAVSNKVTKEWDNETCLVSVTIPTI